MANQKSQNNDVNDYIETKKDNVVGRETLDISNFAGANTKIASVKMRVWNKGDVKEERFAYEVETEPFKHNGVELTAKEYINCWRADEMKGHPVTPETIFNFSKGKNSNAQKFLTYFKVEHPLDLIGKPCEVKRVVIDADKERIGIYYG